MQESIQKYLSIFYQLDFDKIIDHPNILIAAAFWDEERFLAAKSCYRFMRAIDDLIDNYKSENQEIAVDERAKFEDEVKNWIHSLHDADPSDPWKKQLTETMSHFKIPLWTMETFAKSMIYDIYHDGFDSMESFLDYSKGASIAPASVFVHLCGIIPNQNEFRVPVFDVKRAATPCAVFSYIVHIIRDFQKDQHNNLNYFADELVAKYGLDRQQLKSISNGGEIPAGFRDLIKEYYILADEYRLKTHEMIREIKPLVEPRYQLSLDIIFNLYMMVFERIDPDSGSFTASELNPEPAEIRERVYQTIVDFEEYR